MITGVSSETISGEKEQDAKFELTVKNINEKKWPGPMKLLSLIHI